jgi:hypothetical protein
MAGPVALGLICAGKVCRGGYDLLRRDQIGKNPFAISIEQGSEVFKYFEQIQCI